MSTKMEMWKEGYFGEAYGSTTFLKLSFAPSIDKVKFSIIQLETNGREHVDYYLSVDEMREFSSEVLNGIASKKFNADMNENYPKAYQYITGEDGSKHLNIGGGQKGIRVNIMVPEGRKNAVVPFGILKTICFDFRVLVGLVPVAPGSYYDNLLKVFYEGEKKRSQYHSNGFGSTVQKESAAQGSSRPPAANGSQNPQPPVYQPKVQQQQQPPSSSQQAPASTSNNAGLVTINGKIKTAIIDTKQGHKAFQVYTHDNQLLSVMILKERLTMGNLDQLINAASKVGNKVTLRGSFVNDRFCIA